MSGLDTRLPGVRVSMIAGRSVSLQHLYQMYLTKAHESFLGTNWLSTGAILSSSDCLYPMTNVGLATGGYAASQAPAAWTARLSACPRRPGGPAS